MMWRSFIAETFLYYRGRSRERKSAFVRGGELALHLSERVSARRERYPDGGIWPLGKKGVM